MTSRFSIFSHHAHPLDEINASTTPRSYVLNDIGSAEFALSTADPKRTKSNLQFGNLVYIEHIPSPDGGGGRLPDWTGMILPKRERYVGKTSCLAHSIETLLTFRPMPRSGSPITGSPADVFAAIIRLANDSPYNTIPVRLGTVEDLPVMYSDILVTSAYAHIKTLINRTGMDWSMHGEINSAGNLEIYANLFRRKGIETGFALTEKNIEISESTLLLSEQGMPLNVVNGFGQANTKESRSTSFSVNQSALDEYGYLGANVTFMGAKDKASLDLATQARADARGDVVNIIPKRNVLDIGGAYSYLDTGNILAEKNSLTAFPDEADFDGETRARILTIDYNDNSGNVPVSLEVL